MGRGAETYSLNAFVREPALNQPEERAAVSLFQAVNRGESELVLISKVRSGQQRSAQLLASVYSLPFVAYDSAEVDLPLQARSSLAFPCVNYISVDLDNFSRVRRSLEGIKSKEAIVVWGLEGDAEGSGYIHFGEEDDLQSSIEKITGGDGVLDIKADQEENSFLYDYAVFSRLPFVKYALESDLNAEDLRYAFRSGGRGEGKEENILAHYLHSPGVFLISGSGVTEEVKAVVSEYKHPEAVVAFQAV